MHYVSIAVLLVILLVSSVRILNSVCVVVIGLSLLNIIIEIIKTSLKNRTDYSCVSLFSLVRNVFMLIQVLHDIVQRLTEIKIHSYLTCTFIIFIRKQNENKKTNFVINGFQTFIFSSFRVDFSSMMVITIISVLLGGNSSCCGNLDFNYIPAHRTAETVV